MGSLDIEVGMKYLLSEFSEKTRIIDCDVDPFTPKCWGISEHRHGGKLIFNPVHTTLYLVEGQGRNNIAGRDMRKLLRKKPVLNANVLDYLIKKENWHLIPEEWKEGYIFFWGTVYHDRGVKLYVRYLCWVGKGWDQGFDSVSERFDRNRPAALLVAS